MSSINPPSKEIDPIILLFSILILFDFFIESFLEIFFQYLIDYLGAWFVLGVIELSVFFYLFICFIFNIFFGVSKKAPQNK